MRALVLCVIRSASLCVAPAASNTGIELNRALAFIHFCVCCLFCEKNTEYVSYICFYIPHMTTCTAVQIHMACRLNCALHVAAKFRYATASHADRGLRAMRSKGGRTTAAQRGHALGLGLQALCKLDGVCLCIRMVRRLMD